METKLGLAPFVNWYFNYVSDLWGSPEFLTTNDSLILPLNEFFSRKSRVTCLLAYAARNNVVLCQLHGTTIRYNRLLKAFADHLDKVNVVSFSRCLKTPKLFCGSQHGHAHVQYLDRNSIQVFNMNDPKHASLKITSAVASADWADDLNVYFSRGHYIFQWNIESNVYDIASLPSPSKPDDTICAIKISKCDPLLLAVAYSGGSIIVLTLDGVSVKKYTPFCSFVLDSEEVCSMAFPYSYGIYESGVLAAVSRSGALKVWELDTKKVLAEQHFAGKLNKSKMQNFFSLVFVPRPPQTVEIKSTIELTKSTESTNSAETTVSELSDSIVVCNSPENSAEKKKEPKEVACYRQILKLLASRTDGKVVAIDVPVDKRDDRMGPIKRPEILSKDKAPSHRNIVFNLSVINPFDTISVKGGKRTITPYWELATLASSLSLDRLIIIYDLHNMISVLPTFPTLNQQIHEIDFDPEDFTKLLIGYGDGLKMWYFNHNAKNVYKGPASYKVDNISECPSQTKVNSICWHPDNRTNEMLVAFGTENGIFMCVDLNSHKIIYKSQYMGTRKDSNIYTCKWGPIPSEMASGLSRNWACYATYGAGFVRAHVVDDDKWFDLDDLTENAGLIRLDIKKTECVWKDDYNYIAVGYWDGQVIIAINDGLFKPAIILTNMFTEHINCIRWHPDNLFQYHDKIKTKVVYKDRAKHEAWIAIGSKDVLVKLVDLKMHLLTYCESKDRKPIVVNKASRTLSGHQDAILKIDWNKVCEEFLATCSSDTTVQIWHVDYESPLYTFRGHSSRVHTVVWAPWDGNLILSGDFNTIQVWSPDQLKFNKSLEVVATKFDLPHVNSPVPEINEPSPKKPGFSENLSESEPKTDGDDESYSPLTSSGEHATCSNLIGQQKNTDVSQEGQTSKKVTFGPLELVKSSQEDMEASSSSSSSSSQPSHSRSALYNPIRRDHGEGQSQFIMNKLKVTEKKMPEIIYKDKKRSLLPLSNIMENCSTKVQTLKDIEFLLFKRFTMTGFDVSDTDLRTRNLLFLDRDEVNELCSNEISNHKEAKNCPLAFQIAALQGNLKEVILEAGKTNQLSDWMISHAASISREFWAKTVHTYALQLEKANEPFRSALYYSSIHRVLDATRVLIKAGQYKEALILTKSREPYNSQLVKDIMTAWAEAKVKETNYEFAAKIYIANMQTAEASKCLARRTDNPKCQELKRAIDVTKPLKLDQERDPDPPVAKQDITFRNEILDFMKEHDLVDP